MTWHALCASVFSGGFAGLISGVLFFGIGSRLVMRLVAVLNSEAKGVLTDNNNVVGAITAEGTFGLIAFIGIGGGLFSGGAWVMVREWLPERIGLRVSSAGALAMLLGGFAVIEADNRDFQLLGPLWLNIALFLALMGLAGASTAYLDRWLRSRIPDRRAVGLMLAVPVAFGGAFSLAGNFSGFFISDTFVSEPPRLVGGFLLVAGLATLVNWGNGLVSGRPGSRLRQAARGLGTAAVIGIAAAGAVHLAGQIARLAT